MRLRETPVSEFWIERLDNSLVARFLVNAAVEEISYYAFSTEYDVHLKEETVHDVDDVEKLDFIAKEHKNGNLQRLQKICGWFWMKLRSGRKKTTLKLQ